MKEKIQAFFKNLTLAKWCAALMVLLTLVTLFSFLDTDPFWMTGALKDSKAELTQEKETLKELEKQKADTQKAYDELKEEYTTKVTDLQNAVNQTNKDLDKMCSESSFHSSSRYYDCYDNDFQCKPLHEAVEKAEKALEEYQNTTQNRLNQYESELSSLTSGVENAKSRITYLEDHIKNLKEQLSDAIFLCLGIVVTLAGLGAFAAYLYLNCTFKALGLGAAGALILGSILSLFAANIFFLVNPYLYSAVAFAMFTLIIFKNREGKLIPFRVIAIVATVLSAVIVIAFLKIFTGLLFAVTMILVAFVLVPLDFKEYIKIAKHIFLTVITFGIWLFVWIYNVTKNLNKVESLEKRKPVNELLLCMFLPFYFVYWLYKNAEYIEFYGSENGVTMNKISILCFVLGFVCPILSTILMQDKINQIVGKPEAEAKEEAPAEEAPAEF